MSEENQIISFRFDLEVEVNWVEWFISHSCSDSVVLVAYIKKLTMGALVVQNEEMLFKKTPTHQVKSSLVADASVFRERSRTPQSVPHQQQQVLAEKFLRAIEEEREREEEDEYRKQLRNLWNRYQVEEGDIEKELFDNDIESDYPLNNDDRKKKRQVRQFS